MKYTVLTNDQKPIAIIASPALDANQVNAAMATKDVKTITDTDSGSVLHLASDLGQVHIERIIAAMGY